MRRTLAHRSMAGTIPKALRRSSKGPLFAITKQLGSPIQIMGVLEARLAGFDAVVLGGLDEGVWPRPPAADPWFSRAMRREIGLTDPEKRLGLSAHDFAATPCIAPTSC